MEPENNILEMLQQEIYDLEVIANEEPITLEDTVRLTSLKDTLNKFNSTSRAMNQLNDYLGNVYLGSVALNVHEECSGNKVYFVSITWPIITHKYEPDIVDIVNYITMARIILNNGKADN